jgi:hypothetical protein
LFLNERIVDTDEDGEEHGAWIRQENTHDINI